MDSSKKRIEASLACTIACEKCLTHCIVEGHKVCMVLCRDCADICALYARLEARNSAFAIDLRSLYLKACQDCANECDRHISARSNCEECADACRNCIVVETTILALSL